MGSVASLLAQPFGGGRAGAILLSSRLFIVRNVAKELFPARMVKDRTRALDLLCRETEALQKACEDMHYSTFEVSGLSPAERVVLRERRFLSPNPTNVTDFLQMVSCPEQGLNIILNEDDHFKVQLSSGSKTLRELYDTGQKIVDKLGSQIEFAQSEKLGYLTAYPSDLGTGTRFSVVLHLPGLVLDRQMDKVIRALNMCGLVVRGWFGDGSEACGSVFQIANLRTLGVENETVLKNMQEWCTGVIEQEKNARRRVASKRQTMLFDQISRIYGELRFGFTATEAEARTGLSILRMACDWKIFPEYVRTIIDDLLFESQTGHIAFRNKIEDAEKDNEEVNKCRGALLRNEFVAVPPPNFSAF